MTRFAHERASLGPRFAALCYECLLLLAILLACGMIFSSIANTDLSGWFKYLFQIYLFLGIGLYFIWCWSRGGQTLPMRTWKLKLECVNSDNISAKRALGRYLLAWVSLAPAGIGFFWALIDCDGQFLHDRIAGTRIVKIT